MTSISKLLRIVAFATILCLLTAFPALPAYAITGYEDIGLSPDEGEIGDRIYIDGYDFEPDDSIYIYFSSDRVSVGYDIDDLDAYERVKSTVYADFDGYLATYFTVPDELTGGEEEDVHGGSYYVYAAYSRLGEIVARADFTVIGGEITISPDQGAVGTEVEISGEDFGEREDIAIEYDSDEVEIQSGDEETDRYGKFEDTIIIIPPTIAGDYTITVIGDDSNIQAETIFSVEPRITISPESGGADTTVAVSSAGFGYRSDVTIYLNNTEVATERTDRYGSFEVTFNVPVLGADIYNVVAEDEDDNSDKVKFTIAASASLSLTTGNVDTEVTVSGTGFRANKPITITFADGKVTTSPASVTTNSKGSFSASFNVPPCTSGTYEVKISDGVNTDEADFTVLSSASISPVTGPALRGYVGMELTISGTGFLVGRPLTIKFDGTQVATATVETGGSFSTTFRVPISQYGDHAVTISDGTTTQQFVFTMESTPPPIPSPLLPETGVKSEQPVHFDWEDVTDPSGVTYALQVAKDEDFTTIVLEKEGLTDSEYTITEEEKLEPTKKDVPYWWRIKAIDGASNQSEWSGTGSFHIGFGLAIPQWAIYALLGLGLLLLFIFGFWLGRRAAHY